MKIQMKKTNKGLESDEKIAFTPCFFYGCGANERMIGMIIFNLMCEIRFERKKKQNDINASSDGKKGQK